MLKEIWDWVKTFAIAIVLVILLRLFLFDNYVVYGDSMEPNFHHHERLIVNKIIYDLREPKRGEVVVLHAPKGDDYIKRVIALPGETIEVRGDQVLINGAPIDEPYIAQRIREAAARGGTYNNSDFPKDGEAVTVPPDTVFVLGDNRPRSEDSRSIGFISFKDIVGRADLVYWPLKHFKLFPFEAANESS